MLEKLVNLGAKEGRRSNNFEEFLPKANGIPEFISIFICVLNKMENRGP